MIVTVAFAVALAAGVIALGLLMIRRRRATAPGMAATKTAMTARRRDYDEHAGGSRHIRTNPSWRDRLESVPGNAPSWPQRLPEQAPTGLEQAQDRSAAALERLSRAMSGVPVLAPGPDMPDPAEPR